MVALEWVFFVKAISEADSSLLEDDLVESLRIAPLTVWSIDPEAHTDDFNSYYTIDSRNPMKLHNTVFFLTVSIYYNIHIRKQTSMMEQIFFP